MSPAQSPVPYLLDIPDEVLHHILTEVNPQDLGRLSRCCQRLYTFIQTNQLLYKELYLKNWDNPINNNDHGQFGEFSWKDNLTMFTDYQNIMLSSDIKLKKDNIARITDTVLQILNTSRGQDSRNLAFLESTFDRCNRNILFYKSCLFKWADPIKDSLHENIPTSSSADVPDVETKQLSAKLNCLYGVPEILRSIRGKPLSIHAYARSKVYDLRYFTEDGTLWGPFLDTGTGDVDWEKVEAIMIVLIHNLQVIASRHLSQSALVLSLYARWSKPWFGASPNSFVSPPPVRGGEQQEDEEEEEEDLQNGMSALDKLDPYGIRGTWLRACMSRVYRTASAGVFPPLLYNPHKLLLHHFFFTSEIKHEKEISANDSPDYTDFYEFNFNNEINDPLLPRAPLYTHEASRLIIMKLHVTKIQHKNEFGVKLKQPIVHFRGTSSSMLPLSDPDTRSSIRGMVRLTPEGEVRWTSWSIFHGEERWRSEGIQVGGAKSARGVVGTWFDKDFDDHGPAGPTAFWKIRNDIEEESTPSYLWL